MVLSFIEHAGLLSLFLILPLNTTLFWFMLTSTQAESQIIIFILFKLIVISKLDKKVSPKDDSQAEFYKIT
jgi:hypothetical protein